MTNPETLVLHEPKRVSDRIRRGWNLFRSWYRYATGGSEDKVARVVKFVLGDHVFPAIQVPAELTALGHIVAALRPQRALEIGTARGGTLFFLTRLAHPRATIISIDLPGGQFGGGYGGVRRWCYQRFARRGQNLHLLQADSHSDETLAEVKQILSGRPLDFLFIDGDHSYEGVKRDFEMYGPLVREGGVIAFHDVVEHPPATGCEVSTFWKQIRSRYRHTEIIENGDQDWAGIGVVFLDGGS